MLKPKLACSGVCLKSWLSTTFGVALLLQFDDDAHAFAVGLVVQARDADDALLGVRLGDRLDDAALVDLIRNLGDDDLVAGRCSSTISALPRIVIEPRPGLIRFANRFVAHDRAAGRKVRALARCRRASSSVISGSSISAAIASAISPRLCGGMFVAMPTAMPLEPLTQQLRQPARQHARFGALVVEVGNERDRLFVDVGEHVERGARQTRFGVTVGGRRIGIDRSEVAVAVDQRIAQREILRHAHERVVDRRSRRAGGSS